VCAIINNGSIEVNDVDEDGQVNRILATQMALPLDKFVFYEFLVLHQEGLALSQGEL